MRNIITRRGFLGRSVALGTAGMLIPGLQAKAAEANKPSGWQVGIYTRPWAKYDYRVALDAMAEAGFKYAGLMTTKAAKGNLVISANTPLEEAQKVGEEAKQRKLVLVSTYGGGFPLKKGVSDLKEAIEGLRRLIDNVAAAGCPSLLLGGTGSPDLQEPYYKTVAACCDYAAEKGMNITVKPHGGLNSTGPQCRKIVESVGRKNFGLWYDPGNIFYYSEGKVDPADDAATVDGLVFGMSVKDFQAPKRVDLTPGTGLVNFPKVMERLKKGGFTSGALVIECLAPGDPAATLAEAKKARQFVEQLVQK